MAFSGTKYDVDWPVIDVFLKGKSSIDLRNMFVTSFNDATRFLRSYGFDPLVLEDERRLQSLLVESIAFLRSTLMPKEWRRGLVPPDEILRCRDARLLLVWASDRRKHFQNLQVWSCSIIRIMHTIAHVEDFDRFFWGGSVGKQILDRFSSSFHREPSGKLWLGEPGVGIEIEAIERKERKSRNSVILKLLHKPANVAEAISDLVGVRIITKSMNDIVFVLNELKKLQAAPPANVNPTRSRNSVMDLEVFKNFLQKLTKENKSASEDELDEHIKKFSESLQFKNMENPHSLKRYRSVQFTCRCRVKYNIYEKIKHRAVENWPYLTPERRKQAIAMLQQPGFISESQEPVYFPFEIQIIDRRTYSETKVGGASHLRYKKSQVRTARARVVGRLLKTKSTKIK